MILNIYIGIESRGKVISPKKKKKANNLKHELPWLNKYVNIWNSIVLKPIEENCSINTKSSMNSHICLYKSIMNKYIKVLSPEF